jgi:hypothetical protein
MVAAAAGLTPEIEPERSYRLGEVHAAESERSPPKASLDAQAQYFDGQQTYNPMSAFDSSIAEE